MNNTYNLYIVSKDQDDRENVWQNRLNKMQRARARTRARARAARARARARASKTAAIPMHRIYIHTCRR